MAGTGVGKFSSTAGNNTGNMTVNFAENMAPSNVNNAARELMGHIYDMYKQIGDGYFEFGDGDATYTVARSDADTITITSSSDISSVYFPGRKIRITDGGANVVEGTIASSSHSSTTQTVNLTGISLASGTPTKVELGIDTAAFGGRIILDDDGDSYIEAVTDDTIDFYAGGTKIGTFTATTVGFNDGVTITTDDNTDTLTLISTDADANQGPVLNFKRDSSSPADDDILGQLTFTGENDASEAIEFVRIRAGMVDVTDGTEDSRYNITTYTGGSQYGRLNIEAGETVFNENSTDLDFRVESDSQTHAIFLEASSSAVGINGSPSRKFHVRCPDADVYGLGVDIDNSSGNPYGSNVRYTALSPDNRTSTFLVTSDATTSRCIIYSDGDIENHDNSYGSLSDERIKQNITDANSQWDDIKALKIRNYKKKDDVRQYGDSAWEQIGVIAQELEAANMDKLIKHNDPSPADVASDSSFGILYEDGDTIPYGKQIGDVKEVKEKVKGVKYSVLYMKAIKALQEAMARIEALEAK